METLWQDARYALRTMARSRGFTLVAVLTLAIGIGGNAAIFSVVNGILLKPLPYPQPERLVRVFDSNERFPLFPMSPGNFLEYRARNQVFEHFAMFVRRDQSLVSDDRAERLHTMAVSAEFFRVLGLQPALGRDFRREEEVDGQDRVVILSHRLWQRRFASDPNVIGRKILLANKPYEVIGVMPAGVQHVGGTYQSLPHGETVDIWLPFALGPEQMPRGQHYTNAIGRLKSGISLSQAEADLKSIAAALAQVHLENRAWSVRTMFLREEIIGRVDRLLAVLLGAVGLVLLIACANLANLLLARATGRERELAVRAALGASRQRIIRQMLTESLLLAALGGGLGLVFAMWGVEALVAVSPTDLPRVHMVALDATAYVFTLAATMLTAILFGLAPALATSRIRLNESLKSGARSVGLGRHRRLRNLLVVGELGMALVLLTGASLLLRSFHELSRVEAGFEPRGVLTGSISLAGLGFQDWRDAARFYKQVSERVGNLAGVRAAGLGSNLPWSAYDENTSFGIPGQIEERDDVVSPNARFHFATPDYFRALGIPLTAGRFFTPRDGPGAPWAVVINQALARRYFPGSDAVGRVLDVWGEKRVIVGVVGDVKDTPDAAAAKPAFYFPLYQMVRGSVVLVVRTEGDPVALLPTVERELRQLAPQMPLAEVGTLEQVASGAVAQPRFALAVVSSFAVAALLLALVGIYGVMSYAVSRRTQEIGIRMAFGAGHGQILRMILRDGALLTAAGLALGLGGALAVTRLLTGLLFNVSATDPATLAAAAVLLTAAALAACYLPARRAMKVDPMVALRYE